jgi:hypothetical protein
MTSQRGKRLLDYLRTVPDLRRLVERMVKKEAVTSAG